MGQDDWLHPLLLLLQFIAVLSRKHVDLPLVHAQLTDISLHTAAEIPSPAPFSRIAPVSCARVKAIQCLG